MVAFCHPKKLVDSDTWMLEVLLVTSFDIQQSMFKLAMKSNACTTIVKLLDVNPLTQLWHILSTFRVLACAFPEYFKSVEIAMVQVFGSVEDKQCFSSLAFCKSKLCNRLPTNLGLVVRMFSQKFYTLQNFPYAFAYEEWHVECPRYGVGT
jgi:hypothetical protein